MEVSSRMISSSTSPLGNTTSTSTSISDSNKQQQQSSQQQQQQNSNNNNNNNNRFILFGTARNTVGVLFILGISFFSLLNNSKSVSLLGDSNKQRQSLYSVAQGADTISTTGGTTNIRSSSSNNDAEIFAYNQDEIIKSSKTTIEESKIQEQRPEEEAQQQKERIEKEEPVNNSNNNNKEQEQQQSNQKEQSVTKIDEDELVKETSKEETKTSKTKTTTKPKYDPTKPFNIVLFYADDWSFNMIGAVNEYIQTPILDQLGTEGILFTHNCVVASVCMQSRATLYTGQYSMRHQTYKSWADITMYEPNRWNETLYPIMYRNNYYNGFFGKYHHLESFPKGIPVFHKFRSSPLQHFYKRNNIEKHDTQWLEDDGIEFLDDRPRNQPFFLTLSFYATHAEDGNPLQYRPMNTSMNLYVDNDVPYPKTYTEQHWNEMPYFFNDNNVGRARFRERYATKDMYQHHMKNMCRMVTEVDTAIGRIIDKLKDQGVYDNTLLIFTTDNGNSYGQHGLAEKWYAYEESLRVPLIIKDPRMPSSLIGTKNDEFTLNIDLAPTILSAAGVPVPDVMQGRDMAPLYLDHTRAAPEWRKEFLYEFHDGNSDIPDSLALVRKDFKYIYWDSNNYTQFFNLGKDPYEEYDLYNTTEQSLLVEIWSRLLELNGTLLTNRTY